MSEQFEQDVDKYLEAFEPWYKEVAATAPDGVPKGAIAGGLTVLERLKTIDSVSIADHVAPGGTQIAGASGVRVKSILAKFEEHRPFASEGGRTNRGLVRQMTQMLERLKAVDLPPVSPERTAILTALQEYLVERVREFHNRKRLEIAFDPADLTLKVIAEVLAAARLTGKEGPVAQHLVGAKLQLRYPEKTISNYSYSTADRQLGRAGDFVVGDTVFHVTVAPMQGVYDKCLANLKSGLRPMLIVPERLWVGARQYAEGVGHGRIGVLSIEGFVSQNVDEIAEFCSRNRGGETRKLFEIYNNRVDEVEADKSLMIEIPINL